MLLEWPFWPPVLPWNWITRFDTRSTWGETALLSLFGGILQGIMRRFVHGAHMVLKVLFRAFVVYRLEKARALAARVHITS